MSLPRTAADVLENHTTLEVESLDRIYLKVIQMRLQDCSGIAWYFRKHRGEDFGPFFIKFCSYFPYDARLCLNGHEYAKRQLEKRGIKYEPLDNGILSCEDPKLLQKICDGLTEVKIEKLLRKWLARLPHPFPAEDRAAGFRYEIFMQQVEFARTLVLDRPVSGRIFFEEMLRENLNLGRPTQMQLIFDKRIPRTTKTRCAVFVCAG